jgi:hypothetical protein
MKDDAGVHIVDAEVTKSSGDGARENIFLKIADALDAFIKAHVILAALLFPTMLKGNSQDPQNQKDWTTFYRIWCLGFGIVLLLANVLSIVALLTRSNLLDFAKFCFVVVASWISIIALIIANQEKQLKAALFALEEEAGQIRDESVMLIRAGQAGLKSLNKRLYGEEINDHFQAATELLKSVGPLAVLFLNKEKNIFTWGMAGMNLTAKAFRYAQQLLKKN